MTTNEYAQFILQVKKEAIHPHALDEAAAYEVAQLVSGSFGRGGDGFYTTWFDNQKHLKTPAFKTEFDKVINSLRDDGQEPPFASRRNLEAYCMTYPGLMLSGRGDGFKLQAEDFSYYIRCLPRSGDYEIYCFAYDNRWLLPELAGKHELPVSCYSVLPSNGELIQLSLGKEGYYPCDSSKPNPEENRLFADTSNRLFGITRAQEEAMLAGSMFGWDIPAAKPWHYDEKGDPRPQQPTKNEPER